GWLASKRDYSATFLVNFLAFAYLIYALATRWPALFMWKPLAFLGQHSIQVFSFHIFAKYAVWPIAEQVKHHGQLTVNAFGLLVVTTLFVPAWCHAKWRARDARSAGRLAVAGSSPAPSRDVS